MEELVLYMDYEETQAELENFLGDLINEKGDGYLKIPLKENGMFILGNILTYLYASINYYEVEIEVDNKRIYNLSDVFKIKGEFK